MLKNLSLLIVEDDEDTRDELVSMLMEDMENVYDCANGKEALDYFDLLEPDIVLTDLNMPELNGVKLAELIKERSPETSIIFMSAHSEAKYVDSALDAGALEYLLKPIEINDLISKFIDIAHNIAEKKSVAV